MKLLYIAPASNPHSIRWIKKVNTILNFEEITWITYEPIPNEIIDNKINIKYLKLNSIFDPKTFKVFFLKYDYVHVHSLARYLLPSLFVNNKKLVLTAWGSDIYFARKNILIKILQNIQIKNAKAITCDSDQLIKELSKITKKEKIHRINFGTDCIIFKPNKKEPKISNGSKYILSTRNFHEVYDIKTLLKAYCKLNTDIQENYKLILIGKGPCEKELKQFALDNNLKNKVLFPGYVNQVELSKLYANCQIYVSTSLSDAGIAASTAEAMASGAISLITDVRENKKWVNNYENNGVLFKPSNYKQLARKITNIINLPKKDKEIMSKNARKKILNECNISKEMIKFSDLLS